jgi:hypothetical protein
MICHLFLNMQRGLVFDWKAKAIELLAQDDGVGSGPGRKAVIEFEKSLEEHPLGLTTPVYHLCFARQMDRSREEFIKGIWEGWLWKDIGYFSSVPNALRFLPDLIKFQVDLKLGHCDLLVMYGAEYNGTAILLIKTSPAELGSEIALLDDDPKFRAVLRQLYNSQKHWQALPLERKTLTK